MSPVVQYEHGGGSEAVDDGHEGMSYSVRKSGEPGNATSQSFIAFGRLISYNLHQFLMGTSRSATGADLLSHRRPNKCTLPLLCTQNIVIEHKLNS